MTKWVPVSKGVLDISDSAKSGHDAELAITPVQPGVCIALSDGPADLWRSLIGGREEESFDAEEFSLIRIFHEYGIAAPTPHPLTVSELHAPWLSSPQHELVYALLAHVLRDEAIEGVFIKGPVEYAQGLRYREHSGDVDVWIHPSQVRRLAEAMRPWGWTLRNDVFIGHSRTLIPETWGCAIDVHTRFPGMATEPEQAFQMLMQNTQQWEFAGISVAVPSKPLAAVIRALHDLRPSGREPYSSSKTQEAAQILELAGAETIQLTREFGALAPLYDSLRLAFPHEEIDLQDALWPDRWHSLAAPNLAVGLVRSLRATAPRDRLPALFRLVWPDRRTAIESAARSGHTTDNALAARAIRMWCGILRLGRRN